MDIKEPIGWKEYNNREFDWWKGLLNDKEEKFTCVRGKVKT